MGEAPRILVPALVAILLSGCVTARMHDRAELNDVGTSCGFALGEVFQDEEEKRLLFVIRQEMSDAQKACIYRWAKKRGLRPVYVDNLTFEES